MPVFGDGLWWDINWRWMLLWLATAASVLWLLGEALAARRRGRLSASLLLDRVCVYLDDSGIMDNYQMNRYAVALRKQVEQRTAHNRTIKLAWRLFPFVNPEANLEASREVVTRYIERKEPISVIGVILDGLERSDALIRADLRDRTVLRGAALRRARAGSGSPRGPVRLSTAGRRLVLLTGDFTRDEAASTASRTVFTAPFGPGGRVRVVCRGSGLRVAREDLADLDLSAALCLGSVQKWRPESEVLDVRPLAIFG